MVITDEIIKAAFPEFIVHTPAVGRGRDKIVYRADDGGSPFALKIISSPLVGDEDTEDVSKLATMVERFDREITAMRTVSCAHIAQVTRGPESRAIGDNNFYWFGESFLNGGTLATVLRNGRLSSKASFELARALLTAIVALWNAGRLVHRDIKPQNIGYIDGRVVLIDFGTVLFTELSPLTSPTLTGPGTPEYASPEQFLPRGDSPLDFRSDLFQVGIVLHEAITGVHPFRGIGDDYYAALTSFDPAALHASDCPANLRRLVTRLLGARPSERFRSPELALRMLEEGD